MGDVSSRPRARAVLTLPIGDRPDRAAEAARRWISRGFQRLTGDLGDLVRGAHPDEIDWGNHDPGQVRAGVGLDTAGTDRGWVGLAGDGPGKWVATYSRFSWKKLMSGLRELPASAAVEAVTNQPDGGGEPSFRVGMVRRGTGWLELFADLDSSFTADPDSSFTADPDSSFTADPDSSFTAGPAGETAILDVVREVAEMCDPSSGGVRWDGGGMVASRDESVERSGTELRRYGWLTVLPQHLGDRLGGLPALRDSGAVHEAEQLGAGGYWLLATPRSADYRAAEAERLAHILAPILPR